MATSVAKILSVARAQVGVRATDVKKCKYNTWYYGSAVSGSGYDWCETFVQWVFAQCGASALLYQKTANCGVQARAFYNKGRLKTTGFLPGDVVFFHWSNDKSSYVPSVYSCDHVGIIESVNADGTLTTIEGNTGSSYNGEVMRRVRSLSVVSCAGRPDYTGSYDGGGSDSTVSVFYRVRTDGRWLKEVDSLSSFAGLEGRAITDIAIKSQKGRVRYRVHIKGGSWLPYVTGYDIGESENGYAGDKKPIDAVEVYYYTPSDIVNKSGYLKAKYRVSPLGCSYYPWQYDDETSGGQDGYAGVYGRAIDRFQITLAK